MFLFEQKNVFILAQILFRIGCAAITKIKLDSVKYNLYFSYL